MQGRPGFWMPQDEHGRWYDTLAPAGGTLTIATSGTPNGNYMPGDKALILEECVILRITANKNHYIRFTLAGPPAADNSDIWFLAGTEPFQLPVGTNFVSAITEDGSVGQLSITVEI